MDTLAHEEGADDQQGAWRAEVRRGLPWLGECHDDSTLAHDFSPETSPDDRLKRKIVVDQGVLLEAIDIGPARRSPDLSVHDRSPVIPET